MTASTAAVSAREWRTIRSDVSSRYSTADAAAKAPAATSPSGVASTNPAFAPSTSTVGVAIACSPRKPALTRNASPISSSRASRRRRAFSVIAIASTVFSRPAASTIQKCAGRSSQRSSSAGSARSRTISPSGRTSANATTIVRIGGDDEALRASRNAVMSAIRSPRSVSRLIPCGASSAKCTNATCPLKPAGSSRQRVLPSNGNSRRNRATASRPLNHEGRGGIVSVASSVSSATTASTSPSCHARM